MNRLLKLVLLAICFASFSQSSIICAHADDWDFVIAPYGMVPAISGNASIGRVEDADVDVSPSDILDTLKLGAMVQVEAHHSSGFGASLNYMFMKLEDSLTGPGGYTQFDGEVFQGILEGYLSYRLANEKSTLDFYAGVRWWDIGIDLSAENALGKVSLDRDPNWVDPVIGIRFLPKISDNWRVLLQGDVGGFNVSSDSSYNLLGGVLWDVGETYSIALLYRALWVDYSKGDPGETNRFVYDTVTHGPLVGVAFRF